MAEEIKDRAAVIEAEKQDEMATQMEDTIDEKIAARTARQNYLQENNRNNQNREARIAENQAKLANESSIESIRRTRHILNGKIIAVSEATIDSELKVCVSVLVEEDYIFHVPFEEMYNTEIIDMRTVDLTTENGKNAYRARQRQMLAKTIGLSIPIIIKHIVPDYDGNGHKLFIGSRKMAAEMIRKSAFNPERPRYRDGEYYEATVISVTSHSLAATFSGVDFVIQQHSLTERYLTDLQSHYHTNDRIPFLMKNLQINGDEVKFEADPKAAELRDALNRQYLIGVNTIAKAIITRIYSAGNNINIYAWLPDYKMACKIPFMPANDFGKEMKSGDEIQVLITGFRNSGYLDAKIRSFDGNSGLMNYF